MENNSKLQKLIVTVEIFKGGLDSFKEIHGLLDKLEKDPNHNRSISVKYNSIVSSNEYHELDKDSLYHHELDGELTLQDPESVCGSND